MKPIPRVRPGDPCAQCGKKRKMPKTHHSSIPRQVYELDPFCSSVCAREYYGVTSSLSPTGT